MNQESSDGAVESHKDFKAPKEHHEVLGISKFATFAEIEFAFKTKRSEFYAAKDRGLTGKGPLKSENDLWALQEAHDAMMANVITDEHQIEPNFEDTILPHIVSQSEPVPISDGRDKVDFNKRNTEQVWNKVKADKQLRGILAHVVHRPFEDRDSITEQDVKDFYQRYPTEELYLQTSNIGKLLNLVQLQNPPEKFREYNVSAMTFVETMYPKS